MRGGLLLVVGQGGSSQIMGNDHLLLVIVHAGSLRLVGQTFIPTFPDVILPTEWYWSCSL